VTTRRRARSARTPARWCPGAVSEHAAACGTCGTWRFGCAAYSGTAHVFQVALSSTDKLVVRLCVPRERGGRHPTPVVAALGHLPVRGVARSANACQPEDEPARTFTVRTRVVADRFPSASMERRFAALTVDGRVSTQTNTGRRPCAT